MVPNMCKSPTKPWPQWTFERGVEYERGMYVRALGILCGSLWAKHFWYPYQWDRYLGFDQKQTIDIYWYLKAAKMAVNKLLTLLTRYMICGYDSCYAFGWLWGLKYPIWDIYVYIYSIFIIHIYITSHLMGMESASYCYSSQIRHDIFSGRSSPICGNLFEGTWCSPPWWKLRCPISDKLKISI